MKKLLLNLFFGLLAIAAFSQTPDNWTIETSDVTVAQETTTINEGSSSLKVTWTSTSNQDIHSDEFAVTGDASYSYKLDVLDNTNAGRVRMVLFFGSTSVYSSTYSVDNSAWQTLEITGTVPSDATTGYIKLRFYDESAGWSDNGNQATVYVDNAIFTENGGSNLVTNGGFETWPAFANISAVNYVSETALDVIYDGSQTSVEPADYALSGTTDITFTGATIDGTDDKVVHLTGASANIVGDATLDNIADANTNLDFYAGIIPFANINTTNAGGVITDGIAATFKGIVSANDEYNGVWVADAAGAYNGAYIYDYNFDAEVAVGDEIIFTAERGSYNNVTQLSSPTLIEKLSTGNTPYGPDVITAADIDQDIAADTDPAEKWEGQLVKIVEAKITKDLNTNDYFYSANVAEGEDTFRIGDNVNYQLADITLVVGSTYTITGVIDYEDGAYRINPRSMDDIIPVNPSIIKAYSISNDAVEVLYDKALSSVDAADYNLSGTADITFTTATIDDTNDKLVHLSGASATISADVTTDNIADANVSLDFYAGIMPIANTNATNPGGTISEGIVATFTGIVSANDAYNNVWVADAEGAYNGVLIFDYDFDGEVEVGDEIIFNGVLDIYNNLNEIANPSLIEKVSTGNNPYGPSIITGANISDAIAADTDPAESWEGQLVKITNAQITVDTNTTAGGGHYYYTATDDNGTTTFRIGDNVDFKFANIALTVDNSYDIIGVVDYDKGAYRINPRSMSDITEATTDVENIAFESMKLYPNPSNGLVKLEINNVNNDELFVDVYNVIGKLVYKAQITENVTELNLTGMNAGIYYVSVRNNNDKKVTKIIIQ